MLCYKKITVFLLTAILVIFAASCSTKELKDYELERFLIENELPAPDKFIPVPDFSDFIKEVAFIGCGDNIIYGGNTKDAKSMALPGGRTYNFKPMYKNVAHIIENADVAFINQETVMAGEGYDISYYPRFNSPRDLGYDLVELGFDVVNIANNHMLDKNADGLSRTIEFWKSLDTLMIGGYENEEDFNKIRVLESNGIKIAFLSFTYGTNGLKKAASSPLYIPYINDSDITEQIAAAKEVSDFVMVSMHWGFEGAFKPSAEQRRLAKLIADCGADVILGHHPHVLQPIEWIEGKDGNKTLCVFSLGNFMAEQAYDYNMVGGIIGFNIVKIGDSKPQIENVHFTPTVFHFPPSFYNNVIYLMEDFTPELAASHGVGRHYGHTITYDRIINYALNTIDSAYLPESIRK